MKTPVCHALLSALLFSYIAAQCQNGGYKAKGCICPRSFYGPLCEFFVDGIPTVKSVETSVRVKMQITNWNLTERVTDPQTENFKKFEENFKAEMKNVYSKVPNYTDTKILSVMTNGVTVDHDVITKIKFRGDRFLAQKYHKIFQQVKTRLENLKKQNCTSKGNTTSLCVGDSITVTPIHPPSGHDFCRSIVPVGFSDFYSSYFSSEGLNCVSPCHKKSPNYLKCRGGRCRLSRTGPQCL
ncbi:mucin-3B-like [Hyla sarda]|uniref:mucin-3B-like n=1 Tax=Hyla sarda TaxID=327740 RepID=UPI0024C27C03|nr:mucin-3B-like [Hyla sarda]